MGEGFQVAHNVFVMRFAVPPRERLKCCYDCLVLPVAANVPRAIAMMHSKEIITMRGNRALTLLLGFAVGLQAAVPPRRAVAAGAHSLESKADHDARMRWWRHARFGMFIHWGLYAVPAGTWHGHKTPGTGEWIMDQANIPIDQYERLAATFSPVRYDPDAWVRIAKDAGMKYVVITSKHHDGFCLFDTKTTTYDVVDATPYRRDLLKPLAEACRRQGLHFCVYYSIMDWHHPAQYRGSEQHYNPTKIHAGRKAEYLAYMRAQLKELIEQVHPEVLWFDGEWPAWYTAEDGHRLYDYLRHLRSDLIINNRVGSGRSGMDGLDKKGGQYAGDFGTPEQQIPATGLPGVDWESCMTMNNTWGFRQDDHRWKTAETLIRNLVDIASKGGNYLLNVGPTAEGEIPQPSVERLQRMGQWMHVNGESIYGTQASPIGLPAWGRCTRKDLPQGVTRLYLHVFHWPADGMLRVPGLTADSPPSQPASHGLETAPGKKSQGKAAPSKATPAGPVVRPARKVSVERAYLLADRAKSAIDTENGDTGVVVRLPMRAPDPVCSVIVLDIRGNVNTAR